MDWTHIQIFLAVVEHGSLSGAARALGLSQPTLGRRLKAAEAALEVELFQRNPRGLSLTPSGEALLPAAQEMQAAAARLSLAAVAEETRLTGTVRITASDMVSHHLLPKIMARIRQAEPDIELELLASNASQNLLFRESDIAVRMYRPMQVDLIARHVADLRTGIFASRQYVAKNGIPMTVDDIGNHDFVGYDEDNSILDGMAKLGVHVDKHFFKTRCDQQVVHWELAKAGCGIGFTQRQVGLADNDMVQVLPDLPLQPMPVWLTAPMALRTNPRIRRVYDLLADGLRDLTDT